MNNASLTKAAETVTKLYWFAMNTKTEMTPSECSEYAITMTCEMLNLNRSILESALVAANESEAA